MNFWTKPILVLLIATVLAVFEIPLAVGTESPDSDNEDNYVQATLEEAPHPFNGAFREWSLRGGAAFASDASVATSWHGDVGFRNALPFYLADHRLAYSYTRYVAEGSALHIHGFHTSIGFHPLYIMLLTGGLRGHLLSSMHIELGLGPRLALRTDPEEDRSRDWGLAATLGLGFDLPITDPNRGRGLWLNLLYRRQWSTLRIEVGDQTHRVRDHRIFLGLAWRLNGKLW